MKKNYFIISLAILLFSFQSFQGFSQSRNNQRTPMLGEIAPSFTGKSTSGDVNFPDDYWGKWKIIFSHPADFTAVCSTEIIELAKLQKDFKELNAQILVLSTDGLNSHMDWIQSLESVIAAEGEPIKINFPMISDEDLIISQKYGMVQINNLKNKKDIRAVFIIDPENKVSAILSYPPNIGRNFNEIIRILVALQTAEKHNVLTPANWTPGMDVMIPSPTSMEEARELKEKKNKDLYSKKWYMWYKKLPM